MPSGDYWGDPARRRVAIQRRDRTYEYIRKKKKIADSYAGQRMDGQLHPSDMPGIMHMLIALSLEEVAAFYGVAVDALSEFIEAQNRTHTAPEWIY